jgi:hypothetical protein
MEAIVIAKFRVESKNEEDGMVKLYPVTSGSPENDTFYKWTPGGEIRLNTINEAAISYFEVGKEYYVEFRKAE